MNILMNSSPNVSGPAHNSQSTTSSQNKWGLVVFLVLAVLLALNLWRLDEVPTNVTGDEVTFLNDMLHIFYAPDRVSPLSLMGDGSKAGIGLYYMAMVAGAFPESQAILGMRVASVILGIIALGAFYLYLRTRVNRGPALCGVLLLGTNYIYLNFSRAMWMVDGKGMGLIFGLLSFLLVERAAANGRWRLMALGGAAGGLALYSYFGTVFLPAVSLLYLAYLALRNRLSLRAMLVHASVFTATALIVFSPNLWSISQSYDAYTLRSRSVYVGMTDDETYKKTDAGSVAWHQISYTARGFLLLDPAVSGTGPENARYGPAGQAPVDDLTRALFFLAVPMAIFLGRKDLFQPVAAFAIMLILTQVLTVYPPNYARGVIVLPVIYMLVALLLDRVWSVRPARRYAQAAMVGVVLFICAWNVQHYFQWSSSPELAEARQPAIEYSQVPLWIEMEKERIARGEIDLAITEEEWQQLIQAMEPAGAEAAFDGV